MRTLALVLVALSALLVLPAGVGAANGATVSQETPFDFTVYNQCTGEDVRITGIAVTIFRFAEGPNGRLHVVDIGAILEGEAVGQTSGAVYNPTGQPARFTATYDPATDSGPLTFGNRQLLISQGGGDNFVLREFFHVEKTPTGDFVVELDRLSIECRG